MERSILEGFIERGLSLEQMGAETGKHPTTVAYWLAKHGLRAVHHDLYAPKGGIAREELAPLVAQGLSATELAERLRVSLSTIRYWLERHELQTTRARLRRIAPPDRPKYVELRCATHGLTRFVSSAGRYRCVKCRTRHVIARRRRVKEVLVREAGGKCVICGYNRFLGALHFHHLDPANKEFSLAQSGVTRSIARARAEARKCVLLCSNCHAEVEGGAATLTSEIQSRVAER